MNFAFFFEVFFFGPEVILVFGAVASRLIVTDFDVMPPALVAVQVSVVPGVSEVIVVGSHPEVVSEPSGSVTCQVTLTSPR